MLSLGSKQELVLVVVEISHNVQLLGVDRMRQSSLVLLFILFFQVTKGLQIWIWSHKVTSAV